MKTVSEGKISTCEVAFADFNASSCSKTTGQCLSSNTFKCEDFVFPIRHLRDLSNEWYLHNDGKRIMISFYFPASVKSTKLKNYVLLQVNSDYLYICCTLSEYMLQVSE